MAELFAYTDGACSGNPGPGGWGVVLQAVEGGAVVKERELSGAEALTTNNRMELMAAIMALEALERPAGIAVVTDSVYLRDGIGKWIHGWKRNGWKTADKKPVKNADLWQRLDAARARHRVTWEWVRGHAGHAENERADRLARAAIKALVGAAPAGDTGATPPSGGPAGADRAGARAGSGAAPDQADTHPSPPRKRGSRPARRRFPLSRE